MINNFFPHNYVCILKLLTNKKEYLDKEPFDNEADSCIDNVPFGSNILFIVYKKEGSE